MIFRFDLLETDLETLNAVIADVQAKKHRAFYWMERDVQFIETLESDLIARLSSIKPDVEWCRSWEDLKASTIPLDRTTKILFSGPDGIKIWGDNEG